VLGAWSSGRRCRAPRPRTTSGSAARRPWSSGSATRRGSCAGTTFEEATGLDRPAYAAHGGGYPLAVGGTGVVGVALVSGLPQEQDHALIVEVLEAYLAGERV